MASLSFAKEAVPRAAPVQSLLSSTLASPRPAEGGATAAAPAPGEGASGAPLGGGGGFAAAPLGEAYTVSKVSVRRPSWRLPRPRAPPATPPCAALTRPAPLTAPPAPALHTPQVVSAVVARFLADRAAAGAPAALQASAYTLMVADDDGQVDLDFPEVRAPR
jgi:hypothetical protein